MDQDPSLTFLGESHHYKMFFYGDEYSKNIYCIFLVKKYHYI